jgi:nitrogen fixation/metabolism regulation signal transduction histidine kinase
MSSSPPRRFRRRLLALLLAAGLAPLAAWGLLSSAIVQRALSLSPPLAPLLERAEAAAARPGSDPTLEAELRDARLNLAQAELARRALLRRVPGSLALALAASAAFLALGAWALGRQLARPVARLTDGMVRYERGELGHQIADDGARDELALAIRQFNRMGRELVAQQARLRATEQIAAWQGVARALAHELKNPLTAMKMALARLRRRLFPMGTLGGSPYPPAMGAVGQSPPAPDAISSESAAAEALALLDEEIDVLLRMTRSFSEFARLPAPTPRPLDLAALVEEVCAVYAAQAPDVGLVVRAAVRPTVDADGDQLRRALGNLVKNALEASRQGDAAVEVEIAAGDRTDRVRVTVSDAGAGIAAPLEGEALGRGLASTKADGSGLGLPIAHKIVHDHGGSLRLEPRSPRGTRALLELPARGSA